MPEDNKPKDVTKFKPKAQKKQSIALEPEDIPVNIGNKPKSTLTIGSPKLLRTKGQVIYINLKPAIPVYPNVSVSTPQKSSLYAIPIRETKKPKSFVVKLDLPEQENPFYQTEKHRQSYVESQLRHILTELGLTYYGDIIFEEWCSLIEKNGWSIDIELKEHHATLA